MNSSAKKFANELEEFENYSKQEIKEKIAEIVDELFTNIRWFSPVDTGSFLASNRIGINRPDNKVVRLPERTAGENKMDRREKIDPQVLNYQMQMVASIPKFNLTSIHITNDIDHADIVEYGTTTSAAPNGVYRRAQAAYLDDLQMMDDETQFEEAWDKLYSKMSPDEKKGWDDFNQDTTGEIPF